MISKGETWVRVQMPLLAATTAWPVVQHLLGVPSRWPAALVWPSRIVGALTVVAAVALFLIAKAVLGSDLVSTPVPRDGGVFHRSTVYGRIRHPIYTAIMAASLGWSLLWISPLGVILAVFLCIFFVLKTNAEERFLKLRYPEYVRYSHEVPRFFPRVR
jgi:protein-S-isoprenylcysteine O-methyltransferase Ste14